MIGNSRPSLLLTDRDRALFNALAEARLLDREQIQALLNFGSVTRANDRLSRLATSGFLLRYFLGTKAGGRKALYSLSRRGADSIALKKVWRLQRSKDELLVGEVFVEHQLAVNWCWVSMQREPEGKLIRFVRFYQPIARELSLIPDGYAELTRQGAIQPVFLEVDLGTETSRVWSKKTEAYLKLAASGMFQQIFHQQRFKVAVVCVSERRMRSLRQTVLKQTSKLFYFSLLHSIRRDGFTRTRWLRPDGDAHETIA